MFADADVERSVRRLFFEAQAKGRSIFLCEPDDDAPPTNTHRDTKPENVTPARRRIVTKGAIA